MKAQEKFASGMSDTELKQAITGRQEFARKQGGRAIIAFLAGAALLVGGFALPAMAIALYACMALAGGGALIYSSTCIDRSKKSIREINPLWKEMNARSWAAMRSGLPPQLSTGPATQELTPVFGVNAASKDSAKIPTLAPVKIKPITNWN